MNTLPRRHRDALQRAVALVRDEGGSVRGDVSALTGLLYGRWYTRLSTPKAGGWPHAMPFVTRLRQALTHALRGRGVVHLPDVMARETLVPGSGYWAVSGRRADASAPAGVRRIYWNVSQQGAPALVHDLVATLPDAVWWHCKVPTERRGFERPDAAVLYVDAVAWPRLQPLIASLASRHRRHLHPEIPPLTSWMDAGVASACDPGVAGESFGLTLCRRVAEVLAGHAADERAVETLSARLFPATATGPARRRRTRRRPDG